MKFIGKAIGLFLGLIFISMCVGSLSHTPAPSVPVAASGPATRISDTKEREVSVKKITIKGKTIKIGHTSDQVINMLPKSAFMEQAVEGSPADNSMTVTKSYYYGDKYFKLVFMRVSERGYAVVDILEKRFD